MNENTDPRAGASAAAARELDRLTGLVATMRAVLVRLLQDVVRADKQLDDGQTQRLLEANAHLVVTALGAQDEADSALDALDEVSRVAGLDSLTGLPNRALLLDRLAHAISNAKRHGNRVAVLFLDLDNFKQINDSFGHAAGDQALQLVADGLSALVRETDTVSRYGGDEFLILLGEVAHASDAAVIAEKVNVALAAYGRIDGHAVRLSASTGISIYPEDGEDAHTLIDHADAAMYRAKALSLGGFAFHTRQPFDQARLPAPGVQAARQRLIHHELTVAEHEQRHEQLCEANERLVLSLLAAHDGMAAAELLRHRGG